MVALIAGAVAVAVAIGVAIALAGGDDNDNGDNASDGSTSDLVYGEVTVTGTALPEFAATEGDPAVGQRAPTLTGQGLDGSAVAAGGAGRPTMLVFLAHWCPHCQAELPLLVDLAESGAFDDIHTVAVLTGTNASAPNYPPGPWIRSESWQGDVLVDNEDYSAALAYGLSAYPYLVFLDGHGNVVARTSGELPAADVQALVDQTLAATTG